MKQIEDRIVELVCPLCHGKEFSTIDGKHENDYMYCANCGTEFFRQDLIDANSDKIDATIKEMQDEAIDAAMKEITNAFHGKKKIKIKL